MNVRFAPAQLEDLVAANAAAELFTKLYGVNHRVEYVWDLVDELQQGADESKAIAADLGVEALWQNAGGEGSDRDWERSNARCQYLRQAIGLVQFFGEFVILTEN